MEITKLECPSCGAAITEKDGKATCEYCGREVVIGSRAHSAANHLTVTEAVPPLRKPRSQGVAFFLALFLGVFGAHRFYTGHKTIGILYLMTAGGLGIGVIIDIALLLLNVYKDADGEKLTPMGNLGIKIAIVIVVGMGILMTWIEADPQAPFIALIISFAIPLVLVNSKGVWNWAVKMFQKAS